MKQGFHVIEKREQQQYCIPKDSEPAFRDIRFYVSFPGCPNLEVTAGFFDAVEVGKTYHLIPKEILDSK